MRILIAAGGTGGHIYPALAIADALRSKQPDSAIEFVGTASGLENKIIPPKGYKVHHLPIGRLNSNVAKAERIKTLLTMPLAFAVSRRILRKFKPDLVLGVGGHASGPLLLTASFLGFKTAIWEPNAVPGMANRWLSRFVSDCWFVLEAARPYLKNKNSHLAGMPVRTEIEDVSAVPKPGGSAFRVLIFGGSQGAYGLNTIVMNMLKVARPELEGIHFVHQTGASDFARMQTGYGQTTVELKEYLHDMANQYVLSDLVISRSGTGTLFELAAAGKPSVLIPLPTAADDHQTKNAESLVARGAAILLKQKDLTPEVLAATIADLRAHPEKLAAMSEAVRGFHRPRAAEKLVEEFMRSQSASR